MPYEFKLPDLGEGLTEGEIARRLVSEGDEIAEDAPLVEIATDKTTVEIPAPAAGAVAQIRVAEKVARDTSSQATEGRREPIRGIKRQMFEHQARAHAEIPPVTWVEECNFTDVDTKQLLPRTLQAVAAGLREFPELNARIDGT